MRVSDVGHKARRRRAKRLRTLGAMAKKSQVGGQNMWRCLRPVVCPLRHERFTILKKKTCWGISWSLFMKGALNSKVKGWVCSEFVGTSWLWVAVVLELIYARGLKDLTTASSWLYREMKGDISLREGGKGQPGNKWQIRTEKAGCEGAISASRLFTLSLLFWEVWKSKGIWPQTLTICYIPNSPHQSLWISSTKSSLLLGKSLTQVLNNDFVS